MTGGPTPDDPDPLPGRESASSNSEDEDDPSAGTVTNVSLVHRSYFNSN